MWGVSTTSRPRVGSQPATLFGFACEAGDDPQVGLILLGPQDQRRGVGPAGEDLGDAVDDLGDPEDVLAPAGPGRVRSPDLGMEEDAAADQGVPVLGRGDRGGEEHVGGLVGEGPGPVGLVAPLADHVGPVGLPLPRRRRGETAVVAPERSSAGRGQPRRRRSSRGGRRSGRARGSAWAAANSGSRRQCETPAIGTLQPVPRRASASAFQCADSIACQNRRPEPCPPACACASGPPRTRGAVHRGRRSGRRARPRRPGSPRPGPGRRGGPGRSRG